MSINKRFETLTEQLPEDFLRGGQIVLEPNKVTQFTSRLKDEDTGENEIAAVSLGDIVLCEVAAFRQLPTTGPNAVADADCASFPADHDARFWAMEFFESLPNFRLGEMVEVEGSASKKFQELALYSDAAWARLRDQDPVAYGQQMQANPVEVERLRLELLNMGWKTIEFGNSTVPPENQTQRRIPAWRLGFPVPEEFQSNNPLQNYLNQLAYRTQKSCRLSRVLFTSAEETRIEDDNGFSDFLDVLDRMVEECIVDAAQGNDAQQRDKYKLLSSTTGFRFDDARQRRYPVRAGQPEFTIVGIEKPFNFWFSKAEAQGGPAEAKVSDGEEPF